ncbi:Tigger transposable element-derived protein 4 [Araneus ventricosus]|uniref:Tigger transposable element-derived protein 4 n=1 Tax=Araneus ventricosus TaxID=182803 RepID=A0A4Y2LQZ8_ARAVE|nr:Tigger transposable element-derived protein 4 [Araneus ventricosus]
MKKIRIAGYPDLEECLIKWFKQCRDCNLPIGSNELTGKGEQFAHKLGHKDFKSSNGWLENFKNRHNIAFRKLCDESQSVSDELCSEWIKNLLVFCKNIHRTTYSMMMRLGLPSKHCPTKQQFSKEKHAMEENKESELRCF